MLEIPRDDRSPEAWIPLMADRTCGRINRGPLRKIHADLGSGTDRHFQERLLYGFCTRLVTETRFSSWVGRPTPIVRR